MSRKRTSPIWQVSKEELEHTIAECNTYAEVLHRFGLSELTGGNYRTLKERCKLENIDLTELKKRSNEYGIAHAHKIAGMQKTIPLQELLVENSVHSRKTVKRRLLNEKILENKCSNCNLEPVWDNKELILVLDHINGINNDHRLENLRLLCPNCNSQTSTFSGKQLKKNYHCKTCNKKIYTDKASGYCNTCYPWKYSKVQNKPDKELLKHMIETMTWTAIGKKYNVSDNAIRKWAKKYNLI